MGNYQLDIHGISECRWTGTGKMNTKNDKGESYTIIHSGQKDTHHRGVALIMNREYANTRMEWEPINETLLKARFNSKYCMLTIIQCYAPTGSNDSRLHVVELPRGRSFIWQIGVNSSIQDRRQVDRGFLWSRVSCTRQR